MKCLTRKGSMIGAIIGDVVGSRFEFNNHKSKEFELFTNECKFTDDTVMTLAVAKIFLDNEYLEDDSTENPSDIFSKPKTLDETVQKLAVKHMQAEGRKYINAGYGWNFEEWILSDDPKPYGSWGNGAAMKISPVAYVDKNWERVNILNNSITRMTHDSHDGLCGSLAVTAAIFTARNGGTKQSIKQNVKNVSGYDLNFTLDSIRDSYTFDVSCHGSVPVAIVAFLESNSFEDCIRNAISVGGDSDTIAAIACSIAEPFWGVPYNLREKALSYLDDDMKDIIQNFEETYPCSVWNKI